MFGSIFHGFYRNPVFEIALPAIHEKFLENPGVSFQEATEFQLSDLTEDSKWIFLIGFIFEAKGAGFSGWILDLIGIFRKFAPRLLPPPFGGLGIPIFLSSLPILFFQGLHSDIRTFHRYWDTRKTLGFIPGLTQRIFCSPKGKSWIRGFVDFGWYSNEKKGKTKKEGRGAAGMLMVMDMIPFGNGRAMESNGLPKDGLRNFIYAGNG